jgi:hypothetical protein
VGAADAGAATFARAGDPGASAAREGRFKGAAAGASGCGATSGDRGATTRGWSSTGACTGSATVDGVTSAGPRSTHHVTAAKHSDMTTSASVAALFPLDRCADRMRSTLGSVVRRRALRRGRAASTSGEAAGRSDRA